MKNQHTPAPWKLIPFQDATYTNKQTGVSKRRLIYQLKITGTGKFRVICDAQEANKGKPATEEDWANARLILAAPDLLAIVEKLAEHFAADADEINFGCLMDDDKTLGQAIIAALAKAKIGV